MLRWLQFSHAIRPYTCISIAFLGRSSFRYPAINLQLFGKLWDVACIQDHHFNSLTHLELLEELLLELTPPLTPFLLPLVVVVVVPLE